MLSGGGELKSGLSITFQKYEFKGYSMNKVYKSIWNAVTRSWTAVSEAQRIKGKKSRSLSFGVAFVCPLFLFGPLSYAADVDKNYTDPIVIGLDQSVTVSDKLIIDGNDKNLKIDFDY